MSGQLYLHSTQHLISKVVSFVRTLTTKYIDKMSEAIVTTLLAGGLPLIGAAIGHIYRKYTERRKLNRFKETINNEVLINDELCYLRDKFEFNRTCIVDCHNGTQSLSNLSFKNLSMRNERVDRFTASIIKDFQNVPCSLFASILQTIDSDHSGYVINIRGKEDNDMTVTYYQFGIHQICIFKLGISLMDGFLFLINNEKDIQLLSEDYVDIKASCARIKLLRK